MGEQPDHFVNMLGTFDLWSLSREETRLGSPTNYNTDRKLGAKTKEKTQNLNTIKSYYSNVRLTDFDIIYVFLNFI